MWHHWPEKSHVTSNDVKSTEVTLDECYNLCEETEYCQDFTFCDNFRYGTCTYGNTTYNGNTSSTYSARCDMFVQIQISLQGQYQTVYILKFVTSLYTRALPTIICSPQLSSLLNVSPKIRQQKFVLFLLVCHHRQSCPLNPQFYPWP